MSIAGSWNIFLKAEHDVRADQKLTSEAVGNIVSPVLTHGKHTSRSAQFFRAMPS